MLDIQRTGSTLDSRGVRGSALSHAARLVQTQNERDKTTCPIKDRRPKTDHEFKQKFEHTLNISLRSLTAADRHGDEAVTSSDRLHELIIMTNVRSDFKH